MMAKSTVHPHNSESPLGGGPASLSSQLATIEDRSFLLAQHDDVRPTLRAGVVGAAGYTGGEVLRILLHHPRVASIHAQSASQSGRPIHSVHRDLLGLTDAHFVEQIPSGCDVVFLCTGHGRSREVLEALSLATSTRVIDLSMDFRHDEHRNAEDLGRMFLYGLPEANREEIRSAHAIANPGCFATLIQLALLPLVKEGVVTQEIHVQAVTGSTGAGQEPTATGHHAWRAANHSVYKAFTHQHLTEIRQQLTRASSPAKALPDITFIPQRGSFTRGIHAAITTRVKGLSGADGQRILSELVEHFYASHPFTWMTGQDPDLKAVINTNFCHLNLTLHQDRLLVTGVLDNLIKGAAGQAVQNMNLMFGFPETAGLRLKASVY